KVVLPMAIFLKTCCPGRCTGVSFIDSTPLMACHIKREKQHRSFKGMVIFNLFHLYSFDYICNDGSKILKKVHKSSTLATEKCETPINTILTKRGSMLGEATKQDK